MMLLYDRVPCPHRVTVDTVLDTVDTPTPSCSFRSSKSTSTVFDWNGPAQPNPSPSPNPNRSRRKPCKAPLSIPPLSYSIIYAIFMCYLAKIAQCDINVQSSTSLGKRDLELSLNSTVGSSGEYGFACKEVQYLYQAMSRAKGFPLPMAEIPNRAISGSHLQICIGDLTCCTESMESQLSIESERDFSRLVQDHLVTLRHTLESSTSKFDRFFRELLERSRSDLHTMFTKTYGMLYQKEAALFSQLFQNLTSYYATGNVDLGDALDSFYTELYRRMFKILNEHMSLPPSTQDPYWKCVQGLMQRLQPFGEVPDRMKEQVIRSFVASRAFVRGLAAGRDVIHKIMDMKLETTDCSNLLMKMNYCGHCGGFPGLKPCHKMCNKVVNDCLHHLAHLQAPWKEYIDGMLALLSRLEGPFNIESVIEPIDVEISNAIMTFQENGPHISEKVFEACKRPSGAPQGYGSLRRSKREDRHEKGSLRDLKFGLAPNGRGGEVQRPTTSSGTNLEKLAFDIKKKLANIQEYWSNLTPSLCNDRNLAAPPNKEYDCWNGFAKDRFEWDASSAGNDSEPVATIRDQILSLRHITRQIMQAYQGNPPTDNGNFKILPVKSVELPTDDEDFSEAFGSGSGEPDNDDILIPPLFPKPEVVLDKPHVDPVWQPQTTTTPSTTTTSTTSPTTKRPKATYPMETDDEDLVGSAGSGNKIEEEGSGDVPLVVDWPNANIEPNFGDRYKPGRYPDFGGSDYDMRNPHTSIGDGKEYRPPHDFDFTPPPQGYDGDFMVGVRTEAPPTKHYPPPQSMGANSNYTSKALLYLILLLCIVSFSIFR